MPPFRLAVAVSLLFGFTLVSARQTTPTAPPSSSAEGVAVLHKALAALAPATPISDITLSGTARRIAGSDDESGTVVLKALAGTGSRLDLISPPARVPKFATPPPRISPAPGPAPIPSPTP